MAGYLGMMAAGLICGVLVGFCLGREFAPEAVAKSHDSAMAYRNGVRDGRGDGIRDFVYTFRMRALETKNTWTVTKDELDRLEKEMTEDDSD